MKITVRLRKLFLSVPLEEASFARRGFRGGNRAVRERVEEIGRAVLSGYESALEEDRPLVLGEQSVSRYWGHGYLRVRGKGVIIFRCDYHLPIPPG